MAGYDDVRWDVSPDASVPLRFDDRDFIEALEAETAKDTDSRPLAKLLDVEVAEEWDFSALVEGELTIHARLGITAKARDDALTLAQIPTGSGSKVGVAEFNARNFADWVVQVTDNRGAATRIPRGLNIPGQPRGTREAAFGALPDALRRPLIARLRVHTDKAGRPAVRDAEMTSPLETAPTPYLVTTAN